MVCAQPTASGELLALDVSGGNDAKGTNVLLWQVNYTDAQLVQVADGGSGRPEQVVYFPACGRALDIENGRMENLTNVRLWDSWEWSNYDVVAQSWDILQVDGTATVNGKQYPKYKVLSHKDNKYCLECYGDGSAPDGLPSPGTNVDIYDYATANEDKHWVFVPMPSVSTGIYTVRPAADVTCCLAVSGGSTAELARCAVEKAVPDSNSQVYRANMSDKGVLKLESAVRKGMYLTVVRNDGDMPYKGAEVRHTFNRPADPLNNWALQPQNTTVDANGSTIPALRIVPQSADVTGYALDVGDGKDELAEVATTQQVTYKTTQGFAFWPAEQYDATLGTPASVMAVFTGAIRSDRLFLRGETRALPAWSYHGAWRDGFSVRFRTRSRKVGGSMSAWSQWMWDVNWSTGNNGWGVPGEPSLPAASDEDVSSSFSGRYPFPIAISRTATDRRDVEYEVRAFSRSGGVLGDVAHGPSATGTVIVAWQPEVRVTGVAMTPTGLSVMYDSDHTRGGNLVRAEVVGLGSARSTSAPASGSVDVPLSALSHAPVEGESVTVRLWMWTSDGAAAADDSQQKLSYTSGHGATLKPTVTVYGASKKGPSYSAVASGYPEGTEFYLVIRRGHGDRMVKVDPSRILPPLGVGWQLFATYRSGSSWATWLGSFDAIKARGWLVDEADGSNGVEVWVNEGEGPQFAPTYEPDVTTHVTTGRERPVVTRGQTVKATWSLDGWLGITDPASERSQADWLAHAGKVTFRSPMGFWANAYVTDCKVDLSRSVGGTISASFVEVE